MKRDKQNAMIGGVCAGIANYMGTSALVIRIVFILCTFWLGAPLILYPLLWLLMPVGDNKEFFEGLNKVQLDKDNKLLAGVCAGLGNAIGVDAVVIRIGWILGALYFGFGILAYLIVWLLMAMNTK